MMTNTMIRDGNKYHFIDMEGKFLKDVSSETRVILYSVLNSLFDDLYEATTSHEISAGLIKMERLIIKLEGMEAVSNF